MIFNKYFNYLKLQLDNIKFGRDPNYVKTNNVYVCIVRMLTDIRRGPSLACSEYLLTSSECVIVEKLSKGVYKNIFDNATYKTTDDIELNIGTFFIETKQKIICEEKYIARKDLKPTLQYYSRVCIRDHLDSPLRIRNTYDCGRYKEFARCHICGEPKSETYLLSVNTYPVCTKCFENHTEKQQNC